MSEFSIIDKYCKHIGVTHPETRLSVGDDAAVISVPCEHELVISVDTMVAGVHFLEQTSASDIAYKILAVNLSDMAAMGAQPKWATLALSLPEQDSAWLDEFSKTLDSTAKQYGVELIGGDTTQGNLTLSLQIMGLVKQGEALTRSNAKPDDDVYVSHFLGDAALGLQYFLDSKFSYQLDKQKLINALQRPEPRVALGLALQGIANSCIDISDGVIAELSHLCDNSTLSLIAQNKLDSQQKLGVCLQQDQLPLSADYKSYLTQGGNYQYALAGGDDYELCFTASEDKRAQIELLSQQQNIQISRVGKINTSGKITMRVNGQEQAVEDTLNTSGYQHFK